jgi:hypothetical protein
MYRLAKNTLPIVLTVYMALATAFSLTAVESWRAAGFTVKASGECSLSGGEPSLADARSAGNTGEGSFIPPQTGEALLTNTGEGTFSFVGMVQRGLSAGGPQSAGRIFCQVFQVHSKINFINARNSILLKLRI